MKTTRNLLKTLSVLCLFAVLLSCNKDDDNSTDDDGGGGLENSFTFQGQEYPTEDAFYIEVAGNTSIGLNGYDPQDTQINFLFNLSDYVNVTGNYTYKSYEDPTYDPETNFGDVIVYLGEEAYEDFTEGSLTISKSGNNFAITYTFSGPSGSVSGHYSGEING